MQGNRIQENVELCGCRRNVKGAIQKNESHNRKNQIAHNLSVKYENTNLKASRDRSMSKESHINTRSIYIYI